MLHIGSAPRSSVSFVKCNVNITDLVPPTSSGLSDYFEQSHADLGSSNPPSAMCQCDRLATSKILDVVED